MAFKYQNVDLSRIVYGFGTAETFNAMSTYEYAHLKMSGKRVRWVERDDAFMPFSAQELGGYKKNNNSLILSHFAGLNRFIQPGWAERVTRTDSSETKVYYKGNGYYGRGTLYIGGTANENIISNDCPPVILLGVQGRGGDGSKGATNNNVILVGIPFWSSYGGNGGGGGGFIALQLQLPHEATSPQLVFSFKVTSTSTDIYDADGVLFVSALKGRNGSNISIGNHWDAVFSGSQNGGGGSGGGVSMYSLTARPDWRNATFLSLSGGDTTVSGGRGGRGGHNKGGPAVTQDNPYNATSGGGLTSTKLYVNPATKDNFFAGKSGGSGNGRGGGGGGGSMYGSGAKGESSAGTKEFGAGGGGGGGYTYGINTFWYAGGSGASGCIKFYW